MNVALSAFSQVVFEASETEGCTPIGVTLSVTSPAANTISSYYWEITFPDNSVVTSSTPLFVGIFSDPGGYNVSLTINGNENLTIDDYIIVHDLPQANFEVDDGIGCFPLCVNFNDISVSSGTIIEWAWDFGNGVVSSEQNPSYCYPELGVYTPVFSIEDEFGCYNDIFSPGLIEVYDQFPEIGFSTENILDCNPPVDMQFDNSSTGESELIYNWDFGDSQNEQSTDSLGISHLYNTAGIYDVCLNVVDDIGCENDSCISIEIFDAANADYSVSGTTICLGDSLVFTDESTPTSDQWTWDMDGDGTIDSYEQNPSYVYQASGTYSPEFTIIYSNNCQDTETGTIQIEVLEELIVDFEPDTMVSCQLPFPVYFSNLSSGPGVLSYEWYIDGVYIDNTFDLDYVFNGFGLYSIELVATSDSGCDGSVIYNDMIWINEPTISFTNPTVICAEDSIQIMNLTVNSVDPVVDWFWDFNDDDITDYSGPNPNFYYSGPGEYNISLDIITEQGCESSFTNSETITVETEVFADFTISDTLSCAGDAITFCIEQQDVTLHSWNFGDSDAWSIHNYGDTCVVHEFLDTGYFDVTVSLFNDGCNSLNIVEEAVYISGPVSLFEYDLMCPDIFTYNFLNTSVDADSVTWDFGDGTILLNNVQNPIHTFPAVGSYQVTLHSYNFTTGCDDIQTTTINIIEPDASLNISPTSGCPPLAVDFSLNTYNVYWEVDFGNDESLIAVWNTNINRWEVAYSHDGVVDESLYYYNENFFPTVIYEDLGSYDIIINIIDDDGCESSLTYTDAVTVTSSPDFAEFDVNIIESCDSVYIEFAPLSNDIVQADWIFSDSTTSNDITAYHTFNAPFDSILFASVTAIDIEGCTSVFSQVIDLVLPPIPSFNVLANPSCQNEEVQLVNTSTGDIVSFEWDFGDPNSGADNTSDLDSPTHVYQENGDFDICLTVENSVGCQITECQEDVVSIINPIAELTMDPSINNCLYGVQFENTTAGNVVCSEWDFGDGQTGIGINVFHTFSIGVYDLELVVCNEFGCYDTLAMSDILNYGNVIGPFSTVLDSANCAPFSFELQAFNTNDSSFEYFWDYGDGNGDPNGSNTITNSEYIEAGEYCPSLIMTDANGCPVLIGCEEPIIVEEFELESSFVDDICFGDSLLFTIDGAVTYSWLDETFVNEVDDETFWLSPDVSTDFSINGYYSDCVTSENFTLTVNELPTVTLDIVDEICHQEEAFDLYGGLPNTNIGVYFIEGLESTSFDPSMDAETGYTVLYEYTDENTCVNTDSSEIYIHPLPDVNLSNVNGLCENDDILVFESGTPEGGQYFLDGVENSELDPSSIYGNFDLLYSFTDMNTCTSEDSITLNISPLPILDYGIDDVCLDDELVIENNSTIPVGSVNDVLWDFGVLGQSFDFQPNPLILNEIGEFEVTLELTSDSMCFASLTQVFDIYPTPLAGITLENDCAGNEFLFMDSTSIEAGSIAVWTWEIEDFGEFDGQSTSFTIDEYGYYDVQLIVESDEGCVDSSSVVLQVYPNPVVDFSFDNSCVNSTTNFVNESSLPSTNFDSFTWNVGNGSGDVISNNLDYVYTNPGQYYVSLSAISEFGCETSFTDSIMIYPTPVVDYNLSELAFCQFGEVIFSDSSSIENPYEIVEWEWVLNGDLVSTQSSFTYQAEEEGVFDMTLTVYSDEGCSSELEIQNVFEVWPSPEAAFEYYPESGEITLTEIEFTDLSDGAISWYYNFGDGSESNEQNPMYDFGDFGTYLITLFVDNEFGCTDSTSHELILNPSIQIYVPNAFTPDNDGINEVFKPVMYGFEVEEYAFQIWNRWGEMIFESNDPDQGWIGNSENGDHYVQNDVYVWKLIVKPQHNPEVKELNGWVTIVK